MEVTKILLYAVIAVLGTFGVAACVRLVWLAIGAYKINRAGPRRLVASRHAMGRITDEQLRDALVTSGADREDTDAFAVALRERISQIGRAGGVLPE